MASPSNYQDHATTFTRRRECNEIGVATVLAWSKRLKQQSTILDLGCGSGKPIATSLAHCGFRMFGIDASETLIAAYRAQVPDAHARCEDVEHSSFFDIQFDAVISIGLIFLLPEAAQVQLIRRAALIVKPGGHFLFTAPIQKHQWQDVLTGTPSLSLGRTSYVNIAHEAGFQLEQEWSDEGENHYYGFSIHHNLPRLG
jgi:2-polyprenyl-3-methyl-5-hydroxy-6-metoxy-1,4-benzoquinol methylase